MAELSIKAALLLANVIAKSIFQCGEILAAAASDRKTPPPPTAAGTTTPATLLIEAVYCCYGVCWSFSG